MRVKVSVLGHFGKSANLFNGQTVKTKIITEELQNQLGREQVIKIDTSGGWKTIFKAPFQVLQALKSSKNVIIFPAHNGLRIYAPLLSALRPIFKNRKIHYAVIGGWLPRFLLQRKNLAKTLKKFDGIYVETNSMKHALEEQGFKNVLVMPNCKKLQVLYENELICSTDVPYKLCTFSRVMKEKGIEDAVEAVKFVNEQAGKTVYTLDIFGQIDTSQIEWFENLKNQFPEYITYCGCVDSDKSVETLKDYFALLFPTRFFTEGIPGTIIDAYAAGVPVISAKWESFSDVVDDGVTGVGYEFENVTDFTQKLFAMADAPQTLNALKTNCLEKSKGYTPCVAIKVIMNNLM